VSEHPAFGGDSCSAHAGEHNPQQSPTTANLCRTSEARSLRWVSSLTLPAVLKYVPAATAIGVPLSYLWAHSYAVGYASYFGIPEDFVRVGPEAAVRPFLLLLLLLILGFLVVHEFEKYGVIGVPKVYGSVIRPFFFLSGLVFYVVGVRRGEYSLPAACFYAFIAYLLLWWLPPFVAWGARQIVRGLGLVTRGVGRKAYRPTEAVLRHIFRNVGDYPPGSPTLWRFLLIATLSLVALLGPQGLGTLRAQGQTQFPVITGASHSTEKQVILAAYGDRVFVARVQGSTIRAIIVKQADDFKDTEIRSEQLGELKVAN
jgi:hypothetical protein